MYFSSWNIIKTYYTYLIPPSHPSLSKPKAGFWIYASSATGKLMYVNNLKNTFRMVGFYT